MAYPRKLTMLKEYQCSVCLNVEDEIKCLMTNVITTTGFQYCRNCEPKVKASTTKCNIFREDTIKVRRSDGKIDYGWCIVGAAYIKNDEFVVDVMKDFKKLKTVNLSQLLETQKKME